MNADILDTFNEISEDAEHLTVLRLSSLGEPPILHDGVIVLEEVYRVGLVEVSKVTSFKEMVSGTAYHTHLVRYVVVYHTTTRHFVLNLTELLVVPPSVL